MEGNFAAKHAMLLKVINLAERMLHAVQKEELRAHLVVRVHTDDFKEAYLQWFSEQTVYATAHELNSNYRFIVVGLPVIADDKVPRL